jgi:hypothetical protein
MRDSVARERTIGKILDVLVKASAPAHTDHPAEPAALTPGMLGRGDTPDGALGTVA